MQANTFGVSPEPDWMAGYRAANADRLSADAEFARWLATDYVPIAGGWQY
jgi:hypothetical protein